MSSLQVLPLLCCGCFFVASCAWPERAKTDAGANESAQEVVAEIVTDVSTIDERSWSKSFECLSTSDEHNDYREERDFLSETLAKLVRSEDPQLSASLLLDSGDPLCQLIGSMAVLHKKSSRFPLDLSMRAARKVVSLYAQWHDVSNHMIEIWCRAGKDTEWKFLVFMLYEDDALLRCAAIEAMGAAADWDNVQESLPVFLSIAEWHGDKTIREAAFWYAGSIAFKSGYLKGIALPKNSLRESLLRQAEKYKNCKSVGIRGVARELMQILGGASQSKREATPREYIEDPSHDAR